MLPGAHIGLWANASGKSPYKRRLAYLESVDGQYIMTDCCVTSSDKLEYDVEFAVPYPTKIVHVLGGRSTVSNANGLYSKNNTGTTIDFCNGGITSSRVMVTGIPYHGYDNFYRARLKNRNFQVEDVSARWEYQVSDYEFKIALFTLSIKNAVPTTFYGLKISHAYIKAYNLESDLIPVIDNNDIPCMYDQINDKFYYNLGTGQFSYGEL